VIHDGSEKKGVVMLSGIIRQLFSYGQDHQKAIVLKEKRTVKVLFREAADIRLLKQRVFGDRG
jgi:hypothetical protein